MSKIAPISPSTKLYVESPSSSVSFLDYKTEKSKSTGLNEGIIQKIAMAAKAGEDYDVDSFEGTKNELKKLKAVIIEIKADMKAHAKNKVLAEKASEEAAQKKKDERAAEKEAKDADIKESGELMTVALESDELVSATSQLNEKAQESLTELIGEKFSVSKDGIISIAEGEKLDKADFANAFASLVGVSQTSSAIADRSAKYEAQVAALAKESLGDGWVNLFSAAPSELDRVKKGVKAFETCKTLGKKAMKVFTAIPLSTTRALLEMKITTKDEQGGDQAAADEINMGAKKKIITMAAEILEAGEPLTQTDAKNLKAKLKEEYGIKGKIRFTAFYLFLIGDVMHICGSEKLDKAMLAACTICIDSNGNRNYLTKTGVDCQPLEGPSHEVLSKVAAVRAKMDADEEAAKPKPAEKAPKKKAAPIKDELEEDEEEEEEEVVTPVKKKGAKTPIPAPVEEDEDGDEDEDEDEDED